LNYKFELASYKKAIRRAKRTAWQTFCSDIEKTTAAGPEDGYSTDSSLSREMRALGPAIEDVDLSDTEEADVTEEVVAAVDVTKTSTNKPAPQ